MASRESLEMRELAKRGIVIQKGDNTPVALRLRYIGTGAVTSVTTTTATNIVAIVTEGTYTYAFATYATVGALADKINADGIFEAKVLDALRSDATASVFVTGAITAGTDENGVVVYDVLVSTSSLKAMTVALSLSRNFNTSKLRAGHVVEIKEVSYNVDVSAAAANAVRIYQRVGGVETQIFGATSVDATVTTINWASGQGALTGVDGAELIFRVQDGTSVTDNAANYVRVVGFLK